MDNDDEFEFTVNERDMAFEAVAALLLAFMLLLAAVAFAISPPDDDRLHPRTTTTQLGPDIDGTLTTIRR